MTRVWHNQTPDEIAKEWHTDLSKGLSKKEAQQHLEKYGSNEIVKQRKSSAFTILLQQFKSLVIWVLFVAVAISFLLGEQINAFAILAIVIINGIIGFVIEYRADRAIAALQAYTAPMARVLRHGEKIEIPASDVVPGDILLLESGDFVAADARLFNVSLLKTNEAALTGESLPVKKKAEKIGTDTSLAERSNMVYMGTHVVNGKGAGVVIATGMRTEMGDIAGMLEETAETETPLQKRLDRVAYRLLWICFFIIVVIFILGLFRQVPLFKLFMSSVSLAVAAIPEGLPAVVTVALALGIQRMVHRNVLVRRMSSVETLGSLQVICADKTGTMTVGEMTARKLVTAETTYVFQGEGYSIDGDITRDNQKVDIEKEPLLFDALQTAVACNNADFDQENESISVSGDPTEIALLIAAAKGGVTRKVFESDHRYLKELPFDSDRKRMTVIYAQNGKNTAYMKGAPEVILKRCSHFLTKDGVQPLSSNQNENWETISHSMASDGLRLLMLAKREIKSEQELDEDIEENLVLLGLIGMQDPPHESVKQSIQNCRQAGIQPVMITGDHPDTGKAIAKEIGLYQENDQILTGSEFKKMTEAELIERVENIRVYARVSARDKLRIVQAWKKCKAVVGMTGDGVNDAPALKEASIGIAMGKTATAVTKEAADLIVRDNNFTSIVNGIEQGRAIYDNIAKTLAYLLAGNTGELLVVFIALLVGWPLPLLPVQLLWINLVTDGLPAIALATDRPDLDILKRPPRNQDEPLMNAAFFKGIALIGVLTCTVTLAAFAYEYWRGSSITHARDAAFSVLVTAELLRAFGARSETNPIWKLDFVGNMRLLVIVVMSFTLQIVIHLFPLFRDIFKVTEVSFSQILMWLALGVLPMLILEIRKMLAFNTPKSGH